MAAAPEPSGTSLYEFEKLEGREGHRDLEAARAQLDVLWTRLGADLEQLRAVERNDPEAWQFLLRYATDGPLCIQWYEQRRPRLEAKQRRYNALVMGVVLLVFGLAFLLPFQPLLLALLEDELDVSGAASGSGVIDMAALVGVLASGTTIALRLSSVGVRYRQQAAVFHRASAALKEQLYRLETDWRGKALTEEHEGVTRLAPALAQAIRQAVGSAQAIAADERDAFFDTLTVDAHALTDGAASVTEALSSRAVLRSDGRSVHAQRQRELEKQFAQARLEHDTIEAKIDVLERALAEAPDDAKSSLEHKLLDLRLDLQESAQRCRQLEAMQRSLRG